MCVIAWDMHYVLVLNTALVTAAFCFFGLFSWQAPARHVSISYLAQCHQVYDHITIIRDMCKGGSDKCKQRRESLLLPLVHLDNHLQ